MRYGEVHGEVHTTYRMWMRYSIIVEEAWRGAWRVAYYRMCMCMWVRYSIIVEDAYMARRRASDECVEQ